MSRELRYVKELPALSEEQKGLFRKLGIEPTWWWVEGAKTGIAIGKFFYGFSPPAVSAGETVYCTLIAVAKNFIPLGDPLRGYFGIKYNGTEIARVEQEFYGLTSAITAGSFKMPDKDVTVTFFGGHEKEETTFWGTHKGTGKWVEDFSIKVTLKRPIKAPPKPKAPPKKYPPVAVLKITPSKGNMCTPFKLDAKGSYSPVRLISAYKYDVEGDGKFEKYRIPERWVGFPWSYIKPGIFYPTLQVIDEKGYTGLDRKKIEVFPYYPLYLRFVDINTKKPITGAKVTIKGPDKIEWDYKEFLSRTPEYEVPKDQIPKYIIPRPAADSKIVELYSGYTSEKKLRIGGPQRAGWRHYPPEAGIGTFVFPVEGVEKPPQYNIEYIYEFSHPDYGEFVGKIKHTEECYVIMEIGLERKYCTLMFKVIAAHNRKPIKGATIKIDGVPKAITDEKGEASVKLERKTIVVSIEAPCFKTSKIKIKKDLVCKIKSMTVPLSRAICKQLFQILDEKDTILKEWTAPKYKCKEYTTKITPPKAYECVECEKTYIACEKPVIFRVKSLLPKTCTQLFKVETEEGEPVGAATITVKGVGKKYTDAEGNTSFVLVPGTTYTAVAEKEGYECVECEKTFTACTPKRLVFILKKVPLKTCTQSFVVKDKATGEPVAKAKIMVDDTVLTTDEKGEASTSLSVGKGYTTHAEAAGYKKSPDRSFTACTVKPIIFWLEKLPPEMCTQSFVVTDKATGEPIAKAKVVVDGITVYTDEKGEATASLAVGKGYTAHAEALHYEKSPDKKFTACTEKPIAFELPLETCTQSFKVMDKETGKPLQGIALSIIDSATDRGFADVITDEKGEASATLVLGRKYYILTSIVETSPVLGRYRTPKFPVFTACTEKPMVLGLESRYCIQVFKVVDKSTGVPIKGAEVNVFGKKLTTDVKGEASIELPRGGHFPHVFVDAAGYRRLEKSITACTEKPVVFELEKKPIKPPPKVPPKTCTQLFKVETEEGKPISGAKVLVKRWGAVHTDAEGNAHLTLTEGTTYTAVAEKEGYECVECEKTFTACTPKRLVFILKKVPKACTQSFVVKDKATGAAISGAKVVVNSTVLTTDEKGEVTTSLVVGKGYTAHAEAVHYEKSPDKKFTACTEKPIVFELSPKRCTQLFKVETEEGEPVGAATITVKGVGKKYTDAEGKTRLTLTEGTTYTAVAEKEGYECVECEKTFTACTPKRLVFILRPVKKVIEEKCSQTFKVVDEKGEPVVGAAVRVNRIKKGITDSKGKVSIELIIGKKYKVIASAWGFDCLECGKEFTACTDEIELSLKRKTGRCAQGFGVIDEEEKKPIGGATISVYEGDKLVRSATTKKDGRWALWLDWWKTYIVKVTKEGYKDYEKEFVACTEKRLILIMSKKYIKEAK